MNKNTDAVPAGVVALYADITIHTPEKWRASGSELGYLDWVEHMKYVNRPETATVYRVSVHVELIDCAAGTKEAVAEPVELKVFPTKEAAEIFIAELEDFA